MCEGKGYVIYVGEHHSMNSIEKLEIRIERVLVLVLAAWRARCPGTGWAAPGPSSSAPPALQTQSSFQHLRGPLHSD